MASTSTTHDPATATRGEDVKKIAFATEVWREAQAKRTKLRETVTTKSMEGSNFKVFPRTKKRKFTTRAKGLKSTTAREQEYSRRALFTTEYEDVIQIDPADLIDNHVDMFSDSAKETASALGRLIDEVILNSIISDVQRADSATEDAGTGVLTADGGLTKVFRDVVYADLDLTDAAALGGSAAKKKDQYTWAAAKKVKAFTADTLTDIRTSLNERNIEDTEICMTLTPKLRRILEKDADFKNSENIYSITGDEALREGYRYKGFKLIGVTNEILPDLSTANAQYAANKVVVRPMAQMGQKPREYTGTKVGASARLVNDLAQDKGGLGTLTTAPTANDYSLAEMNPNKNELVYFWTKESVFFATREDFMISEMSDLPTLRLAKQKYDAVSCGALAIDDDFCGAVVIEGSTIAISQSA